PPVFPVAGETEPASLDRLGAMPGYRPRNAGKEGKDDLLRAHMEDLQDTAVHTGGRVLRVDGQWDTGAPGGSADAGGQWGGKPPDWATGGTTGDHRSGPGA